MHDYVHWHRFVVYCVKRSLVDKNLCENCSISHWNDFCLIPLGNVLLWEELQIEANNSKFEISWECLLYKSRKYDLKKQKTKKKQKQKQKKKQTKQNKTKKNKTKQKQTNKQTKQNKTKTKQKKQKKPKNKTKQTNNKQINKQTTKQKTKQNKKSYLWQFRFPYPHARSFVLQWVIWQWACLLVALE